MTSTFITTVLMTAWAASAAAQTTGSGVSFFLRSQFHVGAEHLTGIDDRRFRWDVNVGAEIDLMDYTAGRFIFAANYQAILGEELQKFDPNQGNYILLGALTARLVQTEAALVFYHQSRHLGDRPKTQPVDWNMLGGRVRRGFLVGTTYLDARADLRWTVQRSFVDYEWEIDSQVRADRRLRPDIGLWVPVASGFSALTAVPAGTDKRAGPKVGSGSREAAAPSSCLLRPSAGSILSAGVWHRHVDVRRLQVVKPLICDNQRVTSTKSLWALGFGSSLPLVTARPLLAAVTFTEALRTSCSRYRTGCA